MAAERKGSEPADFTAWSDRAERWIVAGIKALVVLLIASQLALQFPGIRQWLTTTDRTEGVPYRNQSR
ncbi:diadenosine tetraphosphatase [Cohnella cellulosilytica]|uniref:Diadenosine tetraphosphatase n=1 Tax=Cohnella cellulosilytica TaxID=986710 RepID=A0ABW2F281_9BACL